MIGVSEPAAKVQKLALKTLAAKVKAKVESEDMLAMTIPDLVSSTTPMMAASDVTFMSETRNPTVAGNAIQIACGAMSSSTVRARTECVIP